MFKQTAVAAFSIHATDAPRDRRVRLAVAAVYLILSAGVAAWIYGPRTQPLRLDNQHYFYIAERAASGVPPHVSNFDPKHQAGPLFSALGMVVGRWVGLNDVHSARLVSLAAYGASIGAAWLLAATLLNSPLAGHLAAAALWSASLYSWHASIGSRPKVFLALFLLATLLAVARRRAFWAGALGAVCYLCWQPGLVGLAAGGIAFLIVPDRKRNLAWLACGAVAPLFAYEAYFLLHGWSAVREQWFQTFAFPAEYMSHQKGGFPGLAPAASRLAATWLRSYAAITPIAIGFLLASVAAPVYALLASRRVLRIVRDQPAWLSAWTAGVVTLAFTYYDHQGPPDLFFVLPIVVVGFATVVALTLRFVFRGRAAPAAYALAAAVFAWASYQGYRDTRPLRAIDRGVGFTLADQFALAGKVAQMARGQTVFAVRCTHLMGMARLENHVNYGFIFPGLQEYLKEQGKPGFDPVRDGRWPDVILEDRLNPGSAFARWLRRNYEPVPRRDFARQGITVFARAAR